MSNEKMITKIKNTISRKFAYYPKTQEVVDLKEELTSIIIDKYNDLTEGTEIQRYKESLQVLSSYKEVLKDLEIRTSRSILKDKLLGFSLFATIYFLAVVVIYIILSLTVFKNFRDGLYVVIASSILFIFITSLFMLLYCNKMRFEVLTRVCLGIVFLVGIAVVYVLPNLAMSIYLNINHWHPSWIVVLIIGYLYLLVDKLRYQHEASKKSALIRNCLNLLALTTVIYFIISILTHYWFITWLVYVAWICICEVQIVMYFKKRVFKG